MDGAETVESQLHLPIDGETALATPIGDDLALIAGVADAMSDSVEVLLNGDPSMTMRARAVSWTVTMRLPRQRSASSPSYPSGWWGGFACAPSSCVATGSQCAARSCARHCP